jgi:hypothetical protein
VFKAALLEVLANVFVMKLLFWGRFVVVVVRDRWLMADVAD